MSEQRKSTTHHETYFHTRVKHSKYQGATVFAREEIENATDRVWYAAVTLCMNTDQFSRQGGRTNARRNYFQKGKRVRLGTERPEASDLHKLALDTVLEK